MSYYNKDVRMVNKPTLWVVFGTRPEAIKMLPLVKSLRESDMFDVKICSTGQHKEMLLQVFDTFGMSPDISLDVMEPNQTLTTLSVNLLRKMEQAFVDYGLPERVLVHGDTSTAFAASLAAFYQGVPVSHVEAGLRTHDLTSPFPEEANRQLVKVISDSHFAPTPLCASNLKKENVSDDNIFVTGNTVIDGLLWMKEIIAENPSVIGDMKKTLDDVFSQYSDYILVTGHRRENHGGGFDRICEALSQLSARYPEKAIIYPVHLNPKVMGPVKEKLGHLNNVLLIEPQQYAPFVALMNNATLIMTDSGGVQEEAPSLGVPVLVMRDTTERQEAVEAGTVKLVGSDTDIIVKEAVALLDDAEYRKAMLSNENPYGDGNASQRITDALIQMHQSTLHGE